MIEKTDWIYLLAIVVLVLATILALFDKISQENLVNMFLLVLGYIFGGVTVYAYMKLHQKQ